MTELSAILQLLKALGTKEFYTSIAEIAENHNFLFIMIFFLKKIELLYIKIYRE